MVKMQKSCCMVTDSFIINIKTEDFYKDIADDFEKKSLIHQIMNAAPLKSIDQCL